MASNKVLAEGKVLMTSIFRNFYEAVKTIAFILIIAFIIRYFLIQPFIVEGSSMEPNFHNSEYILVNKFSPRLRDFERGDVVVFKYPGDTTLNYIKRIIGVPDDKIAIRDNKLYINGKSAEEDYLQSGEITQIKNTNKNFEVTLGENEYFVLGDNREHSSDSRDWGTLHKINIIGRAWLTVYPFKFFGLASHEKPIMKTI